MINASMALNYTIKCIYMCKQWSLGRFGATVAHFPAVADGIEEAAVAGGTGVAAGLVG